MGQLILGAAVLIWGGVHSLLASNVAKEAVARHGGRTTARLYRLGYNAFAFVSFLPIVLLTRIIPDRVLYFARPPWLWILLGAQALSAAGILVGLLQTGVLSFMGLRQAVGDLGPERLVTTGLYRIVRHPLYLLGLLVLWLSPLMTGNLLAVFVALTIYIVVGASLEESRMLKGFGDAYAEYAAITPMILPGTGPRPPSAPTERLSQRK